MPIAALLITLITLYQGLILLRALVSWFTSANTRNGLLDLLKRLTDPILEPIRQALPATGEIDISPLVALIGLELLKRFLA